MENSLHTTRMLAIAETWNPARECLDLDLDEIPLGWKDIALFIEETGMTQQGFAEVFMGGLITRETVARAVNCYPALSRMHKFIFIHALRERMHLIEHSKGRRHTVCPTCGN